VIFLNDLKISQDNTLTLNVNTLHMKRIISLLVFCLGISLTLNAQENSAPKEPEEAIEDNSFLIEEAYNQEERVVQHIQNALYQSKPSKNLMYSFTQEWPLFKYKQQISYTIPYSFLDGNSIRGIGDVLINYRYQLFYKDDWACFSPRLSLILPTGDSNKGLGYHVWGWQVNLPISKRLSNSFVLHLNAGATIYPNVKAELSNNETVKNSLTFYNAGGSLIWLTSTNFNVMLEYLNNFNSEVNLEGKLERSSQAIINPGIRGAINLGKLQIVPGASLPIFMNSNDTNVGLFFYLSFEHPY
jgi:hypothetical protein